MFFPERRERPGPYSPPTSSHIKQRAVPRMYYLTFRISDGKGED